MAYRTFNDQMENFRILIWNAGEDATMKERLATYGYSPERINQGKTLWTVTDTLNKKQDQELYEQKNATNLFNEAWDNAKDNLKRLKRFCRLAFSDDKSAWSLLKLYHLQILRFEDWLINAETCHANLLKNPGWVEKLGNYGYTKESLQTLSDEVQKIKSLQERQHLEMGDAQQATQEKWDKFEELKDYCYHLTEVARIEFEEDPQYLEKLGMLARS